MTSCFRLLYVNNSKTVRSRTLYALTSSLVNIHATSLEVVSNYIGTSLRQTVVDFLRTLWRSSTYNLNVRAFLDVVQSRLSVVCKSILALCECYEYEVGNGELLNGRNFLDNLLGDNLWLAVAELVDLSVQSIDFSLVTRSNDCEVVSTVRVLELVNETCIQLYK